MRRLALGSLERLETVLSKMHSVLAGYRKPFDERVESFASEDDISDSDEGSSSSSESVASYGSPTLCMEDMGALANVPSDAFSVSSHTEELPQLLSYLKLAVSVLYRLPIRHPATVERIERSRSAQLAGLELYQHLDTMYVKDLFPDGDERLVAQLGSLVTYRRQLLYYRQNHRDKLKSEIDGSSKVLNEGSTSLAVVANKADDMPLSRSFDEPIETVSKYTPSSRNRESSKATTF